MNRDDGLDEMNAEVAHRLRHYTGLYEVQMTDGRVLVQKPPGISPQVEVDKSGIPEHEYILELVAILGAIGSAQGVVVHLRCRFRTTRQRNCVATSRHVVDPSMGGKSLVKDDVLMMLSVSIECFVR